MTSLWPQIEPILAHVQKPARYIGCEDGAVGPGSLAGRVGWLLMYPDTYEIGLPNQGLQILYEILNERPDARAERSYAPWTDMEAEMRRRGVPLFSVDSHRPRPSFDLLAFNLSAELVYTNLLNCVDLAGVPVRAAERGPEHPLIVAGGHCTFNPEPLADFVDLFVIGDGEEVVGEITDAVRAWKAGGRTAGSRQRLLHDLARVPGVYVPSCYDVVYEGPDLVAVAPRYPDVPDRVEKRTIADLADWPYPKQQLVPMTEVVHDRLNVEIFRGCTRGCRFCQAGMITRPVRERPAAQVRRMVSDGLRRTGYDEVSPHLAVERRLLRHRRGGPGHHRRPAPGRRPGGVREPGVGEPAEPAGRRLHRRHRHRDPEGPPDRPDVRARGRHVADAPGDQQAHPGRGSLRRGGLRLLPGMAAGEALLPHRPADRDRRGHPRDRRAGPRRARRSGAGTTGARR